ncbi:AAA family ATPase [Acinetobacter sp. Z1]|uniref:ATP-dependent nuclease n=1 Tax=Acinetobacter sp. Z1 TaxID=2953738 RepID=UPI0020C88F67|nr:AAA family ATPase [Acinetobacter sp. Z1]UTO18152.1 AAA family ATPase [Acinetobacter sp. Z1]
MKLTKFTIKNFRSITDGSEINLTDYSVLVGKNNEGKTTVLLALKMAMDALISHGRSGTTRNRFLLSRRDNRYEWERDFPISLQNKSRIKKVTIFRLYFELDVSEQAEFKRVIKSISNKSLCIEITFDEKSNPDFLVPKRGSSALTKKSAIVSKYIAERIQFTYIPAIRTDKEAIEAINSMIEEELRKLEEKQDYKDALSVIAHLQQPVLDNVSLSIERSLQNFLPNIQKVELGISEDDRRYRLRRDYFVEIDDGNKTDIRYKGDGVKSLAAIGLLKDRQKIHNGASIIAIEEPESHLHPSAMHSLKQALEELSVENQLVISTHNPIFIHRDKLLNNILVSENKVKSVKKIQEIRDCLGVRISDNLEHARKVIIVEGECDFIIISKLIKERSANLSKQMKEGDLVVKYLGGVSKLGYMLKHYQEMLCSCFIIVDNDEASKVILPKLIDAKEISNSSYSYLVAKGKKETEIENLFKIEVYIKQIEDDYGVNLKSTKFSQDNNKWSHALKKALESQGKDLSEAALSTLKKAIAIQISNSSVYESVHECNRNYVDSLIEQLEKKFHN